MDAKKLAAEAKAKALADLRAAEAMEADALLMEKLAAKHGWQVHLHAVPKVEGAKRAIVKPITIKRGVKHVSKRVSNPPVIKQPEAAEPPVDTVTARAKAESVKVIRQLHRPVPLGELYQRISKNGVTIGGKNPTWALSSYLGKVPDLESTPRGWWLKGEPPPPEDDAAAIGKTEGLFKD